jgi:hypothetical protein
MVVSDMVFSLVSTLYRCNSRGKRGFHRKVAFATGFLLRCGRSWCALGASPVSFAQILDKPGKTIRARAGIGIYVSSFDSREGAYSGNLEMD